MIDPTLPVSIHRDIDGSEVHRCATVTEAETYIAKVLAVADPVGVERGDYYVDAPASE